MCGLGRKPYACCTIGGRLKWIGTMYACIVFQGFQSLGIYLVLVGSEVWTDSDKISINTANASATLQEWANYRMTSINPYTYNDHGVLIT